MLKNTLIDFRVQGLKRSDNMFYCVIVTCVNGFEMSEPKFKLISSLAIFVRFCIGLSLVIRSLHPKAFRITVLFPQAIVINKTLGIC